MIMKITAQYILLTIFATKNSYLQDSVGCMKKKTIIQSVRHGGVAS